MHKKLTISIDEVIYKALYKVVGAGKISQFIEGLVRPYVVMGNLSQAYQQMAEDEQRECEAVEWSENLMGDIHAAG